MHLAMIDSAGIERSHGPSPALLLMGLRHQDFLHLGRFDFRYGFSGLRLKPFSVTRFLVAPSLLMKLCQAELGSICHSSGQYEIEAKVRNRKVGQDGAGLTYRLVMTGGELHPLSRS